MRGQRKNPRKAVQPFENKKRKIDIFKNYEANGVEKIQRKLEIFSTLISKKSILGWDLPADHYPERRLACCDLDGNIIPGAESRRNVYLNGCSPDCHNCHDRSDSPRR